MVGWCFNCREVIDFAHAVRYSGPMEMSDHEKMLKYLRHDESLQEVVVQHATGANILAFVAWMTITLWVGDFRLLWWIQILAACLSLGLANWIGRSAWLISIAHRLREPFSWPAYVGRLPFVLPIAGIFLAVLWLIVVPPLSLWLVVAAGLGLASVFYLGMAWIEFNRLRKICLTHL